MKDFGEGNHDDMHLAVVNDRLIVEYRSDLWVSDGTESGTWELTAGIADIGQIGAFTPFGNQVFFGIQSFSTALWQYWITDRHR